MAKRCLYTSCLLFLLIYFTGCQNETVLIGNDYHYIKPKYDQVGLKITKDTLSFSFPDSRYYKIQSFNTFESDSMIYVAFFDVKEIDNKKSSLLIYNFLTQKFVTQIPVTRFISNTYPSFTSVFIKTFDSIFVFNDKNLFVFDSAGAVKKKIDLLKAAPNMLSFNNGIPPVFNGDKLFTGVKPPVANISLSRLQKEHILYEFDLKRNTANLFYNLPEIYYTQYYGYPFLNNSYCYNDSNRFVLSFAADSNIYETDLMKYNNSYYGKSSLLEGDLIPTSKSEMNNFSERKKDYLMSDSYGEIYYDRSNKRYLRVALRKISEADYKKHKPKPQSVIIFNKDLGIVGETSIPENVELGRLFWAENGGMYTQLTKRTNNLIQFIRLEYEEKPDKQDMGIK